MQNLLDKRAFDGAAFQGGTWGAAVAGQYSYSQLFNPAASGKLFLVRRLTLVSLTNTPMNVGRHDVLVGSAASAIGSKKFGGPATVAQLRFGNTAAVFGTVLGGFSVVGAAGIDVVRASPFIVSAGQGIITMSGTVNVEAGGFFEWEELNA